ncbi:MAG: molybdopterin-dependent oxidoreductase [Gammaproteobacteria bacterium]|nr:molybdopterin-dependent oxidoreductase [Gammaproteobacteria bacterium]MCP4982085.1 molybdopterin-dependent oxidoreductase [Gammaproteobacteria bacterium]
MTNKIDTRVTTSHWGAFRVLTEGNRIVATENFAADPQPSRIPDILPAAVHHKTRIARPSIRRGWLEQANRARDRRGRDDYLELPWDEALDIAAAELKRVIAEHGNESIFGGSYGWASAGRFHHALGQVHRFLNVSGGYVSSLASYSTAAAQAIIPHVFGMHFLKLSWAFQNSWPTIAQNTKTLVMFGGINPKNSQVSMGGVTHHETDGWFKEFDKRGIRRINISPQITDTPAGAEWLAVIPGTDTAMMLGIAHALETGDLVERQFIEGYTTGYERFRSYLLGETDGIAKTPAWAAQICGIEANTLINLAQTMASTRTLITVAWSLQRAQNGEQTFWMAATLAAMLGQIGLPGGGIGYGYGAIGGVGVSVKRLEGLTFPQGENPVSEFIPVARIADMLLNPGKPYDFNGQHRNYPDIRLVYWCGGNPFHHHQDLNRLEQAFCQPETIIVHEPWWTATAKRADIVFPATTPYEREDIGRAMGDSYLFHMPRLIDPVGEARDDYEIFNSLAQRMGFEQAFSEGRSVDQWLLHLYEEFRQENLPEGIDLPDYDELRRRNWIDLPVRGAQFAPVPFAEFRRDPEASPLGTPSGRIEIFSQTIAQFGYDECPGHPCWHAPDEWLGADLAREFPLHLVSPQPGDKLHSQMECALADIPGARPSAIEINPADAHERRLNDGDLVKVFNARGACRARAHVSNDIRRGVVALPTGAWLDTCDDGTDTQGNPNILTRDLGTSRIGQGSSAHTTLVEIVRLAE